MKEYIEAEALKAMAAVLAPGRPDQTAHILELIFDYYDEHGDLDWDLDKSIDEEETDDVDAMTEYVRTYMPRLKVEADYTDDELRAMINAELAYEESLI